MDKCMEKCTIKVDGSICTCQPKQVIVTILDGKFHISGDEDLKQFLEQVLKGKE